MKIQNQYHFSGEFWGQVDNQFNDQICNQLWNQLSYIGWRLKLLLNKQPGWVVHNNLYNQFEIQLKKLSK